jgi:hypothetical protein
LAKFRATLAFIVAYLLVNYVFVIALRSQSASPIVVLVLSPFNVLENFSRVYSSPSVGFANNFLGIALLILLAEAYYHFLRRGGRRFASIDLTFVCGVAATYLLSGLQLWMTGRADGGTSIIGFSVALFLLVIAFGDWLDSGKKQPRQDSSRITGLMIHLSFITVSLILAMTYLVVISSTSLTANPSYPVHVMGAAISGPMVALAHVLWNRTP